MVTKKLPTVLIKGKEYVQVKDRVLAFNEKYPNGRITTEIISHENGLWIIKATVMPDIKIQERYFTGFSQAKENDSLINKTSALENAETSAVGRALAMMGIGVIENIGSADEVKKAINTSVKVDNDPAWIKETDKPTDELTNEHFCTIHNRPMKQRTAKNGGHYWDHRWQDENGTWQKCDGKVKVIESLDK